MKAFLLIASMALAGEKRRFDAADVRFIDARTSAGGIEVSSGDAKMVLVEETRPDAAACDVEMEVERDVLILRAQKKAKLKGKVAECRAGWKISAPAGFGFDGSVGSGEISVKGMSARLGLKTGSGAIRLEDVSGNVTAKTGSGPIEGRVASSTVTARCGSGAVRLEWTRAPEEGKVDVKTGSGDISLKFPKETKLKADLRTGSGSRDNAFPQSQDAKLKISASAGSGGISILRR